MSQLCTSLALAVIMASGMFLGAEPATRPADIDPFAFMDDYRIHHYLESAVELQKLPPDERATRLKAMASDPARASEVFPLCRMLFETKGKEGFRPPMIGGPFFIGDGTYAERALEPITIFENVPILVVRGYMLAGHPEPPEQYVQYCLEHCNWRNLVYESMPLKKRKEIVDRFIAANSVVGADAEWLREQAE